jgi:hypothetical protein
MNKIASRFWSPGSWKWETKNGAKMLVSPTDIVLEARASKYKPPSIYVKPKDARAIELVPEMIEVLKTAEMIMRVNNVLVGANRIRELLTKIQG